MLTLRAKVCVSVCVVVVLVVLVVVLVIVPVDEHSGERNDEQGQELPSAGPDATAPLVHKCCAFDSAINPLVEGHCVADTVQFAPTHVYYVTTKSNATVLLQIEDFNFTQHFNITIKKISPSFSCVPLICRNFKLLESGELFVEVDGQGTALTFGPERYCIDNFVRTDPATGNTTHQLNALICNPREKLPKTYYVSSTCMLISCAFILLTVGVYAWLPELRNLHGMVLIAYLLSFFVGFLFLATMQILLPWNAITIEMCFIFTFIIYYSLLAAFFWLNVMCYDIWWTFSGKRAVSGRAVSVRARFCRYAAYAFGVPAALTLLLASLEFSVNPNNSVFLPRIKLQGCFLHSYSKLLYLYVPMVVLCVANLVFFVLTAIKIAQIKKQTKVLNKKDEQRFSLYVKLFVVMGVNWILEVVSSFFPNADYIWKFTDAYNVLVGLIIFIIFVCKRKTLVMIRQRLNSSQRSNCDTEEMRDMNSKKLSIGHKNKPVRGSVDTVRTSLGADLADTDSVGSHRHNDTAPRAQYSHTHTHRDAH